MHMAFDQIPKNGWPSAIQWPEDHGDASSLRAGTPELWLTLAEAYTEVVQLADPVQVEYFSRGDLRG